MVATSHKQEALVGVAQLRCVTAVGGGVAASFQLGESLERVADSGVGADNQDVVRLALLPQVNVMASVWALGVSKPSAS